MKHKIYQKLGLEEILADAELSAYRIRNLVTSERLAGWLAGGWGRVGSFSMTYFLSRIQVY